MSWACEYCGAEFDECEDLVDHIKSWHPGQAYPDCPAPPPEPPEPPEPPPPPPPPPDEDEREFVETYREVDIYWLPALEMYWAQVEVGYVAVGWTLEEIKAEIDEILDFLNPPPPPPDGLLAELWAKIVAWINENIGSYLQPLWDWIIEGLAAVSSALESLGAWMSEALDSFGAWMGDLAEDLKGRWDTLTTETLPGIWEGIKEMGKELHDALDQAIVDTKAWVDTKLEEMRGWTRDLIATTFPEAFIEDPEDYISGFSVNVTKVILQGIVKSFWEGLEEGLEE